MKILIAEDDLVARAMLKRILSHLADEILEASDGIEALGLMESEDPDFLFTDLQMPRLDGRALLEAVRSSIRHGKMPVVCMSAIKDKAEVTALLQLGIQDYILKPIRPAEVHERFRKVIAEHSGWRTRKGPGDGGVVMVVDPDAGFRELVKPLLEDTFTVIEAVSGAHALRLFKESDLKPSLVIAAVGLPLVNEIQLSNLLIKLAVDTGVSAPAFWLSAEDEAAFTDRHAVTFAGCIRRSTVPEAMHAELRRTVLKGMAPGDRLKGHFADGARRWSLPAIRQALAVMSGHEVTTISSKGARPIEHGVTGWITLANADGRVNIRVACPKETALELASNVPQRDPEAAESGAATMVRELTITIGGSAQAALAAEGLEMQLSAPTTDADFTLDPSTSWDLGDWFETKAGNRCFVGMAVEMEGGSVGHASDAPAAVDSASDADDEIPVTAGASRT